MGFEDMVLQCKTWPNSPTAIPHSCTNNINKLLQKYWVVQNSLLSDFFFCLRDASKSTPSLIFTWLGVTCIGFLYTVSLLNQYKGYNCQLEEYTVLDRWTNSTGQHWTKCIWQDTVWRIWIPMLGYKGSTTFAPPPPPTLSSLISNAPAPLFPSMH